MKLSKSFIVTIGILLGIIIIVNTFFADTSVEGFQEGASSRATVQEQTCDMKSCSRSFKAIDNWFEGKSVSDMSGFFNEKTGALLSRPKYPFRVDRKDRCEGYIQCKANNLVAQSSAPAVEEPSAPSAPSASSASSAPSATSGSNVDTQQVKSALAEASSAVNKALAAL